MLSKAYMDIFQFSKALSLIVSLLLALNSHAKQSCHPLSISTCTLPFPSNFYSQDNSASDTGKTVDLKGSLLSQQVEDALSDFSSIVAYEDASGFSAAGPIMFELEDDFDENSLPIDGGKAVLVFDQDSGLAVPIRSKKYHYAENNRFDQAAHIIEIFPRARFEFGHTYTAVITNSLLNLSGQPVPAVAAMNTLIQQTSTWDGAASMQTALQQLEQFGISADQVVSFVEFTVGDEKTNNEPLFGLIEKLSQQQHPVRKLKTTQLNIWPYAASVTGQVRLSDFRKANGQVDFSSDAQSNEEWANFFMMLPISSKHGKSPIAIYGHGIGMIKETMLITTAFSNARRGIATIAIDQPNHGSRSKGDGGNVFKILKPEEFTRLSGMIAQSPLDMTSLLIAIQTSLADLDVAPSGNAWWHQLWYSGGIDTPDIDIDRIHYQGTSMGGVLGTSFIASAKNLKSAFLQVSGVGISNILTHSILFESFGFENLIPDNASAGEAALFIQLLQQEFDKGDAINFVHYIREPIHGRSPKKLVLQYGIGDEVIYNPASEALAEIADLPLIVPSLLDIAYLRTSADYEDGYGLVQNKPLIPTKGMLDNIFAHVSFIRPNAFTALKLWVEEVVN
ncbi:MAG: pimeloyl-ACP methyl ester carboxylesterase [Oleispira sp.]|jgi:pimeloyl-ACP methyl ester carboxylesterase